LQCVLAAKILTVDFVVCTLAVKKKSGQVSTCRIGPFPCQITASERAKTVLDLDRAATVTSHCTYVVYLPASIFEFLNESL
jgi:hypothetical protein